MRNFTFKRQLLFVMFMLLGCLSIQAADDDLITKQITIKLDEAGTLPNKIGSTKKYQITNLKIIGEINGTDWCFIREMAGRNYELLKTGQMMVDGIPVLSPTCLTPFNAKAWLDLKERKLNGEQVDSKNIKKHKNDVFRLAQLITANTRQVLSPEIAEDMKKFLSEIADETVDLKSLGIRGTDKKKMTEMLYQCYGLKDNT